MKNHISINKSEAIGHAQGLLRFELKTNRLINVITSNKSCQCACGETQSVVMSAGKFENQKTVIVGYCSECGEK